MAKAAAVEKDEDPRERLERMRTLARDLMAEKAARVIEADGREATDWQELHSPTDLETLIVWYRDQYGHYRIQRTRAPCRRAEANLHRMLDAHERDIMERIARHYEVLTEPVRARVKMLSKMPERRWVFSEREIEKRDRMVRRYLHWARECARDSLSVAAALDIIVGGMTAKETDRRYRKRDGWALRNLREALAKWC